MDTNGNRRRRAPQVTLSSGQRSGIFTMAALFLLYSLWRVFRNFRSGDGSLSTFILAVVVLGGGAVLILFIAWREYRNRPREDEEAAEEAEGGQIIDPSEEIIDPSEEIIDPSEDDSVPFQAEESTASAADDPEHFT